MSSRKLFCIVTLISSFILDCQAKVVYDTANDDIQALMSKENTTYILRHFHEFKDSLFVPAGCELRFNGGSLCGPIIFNRTKLSGAVNLHGSTISGSVSNNFFNASWICHRDGINDDAYLINQIINVCHSVYFPKGVYNLISKFNPIGIAYDYLKMAIPSHIGIIKDGLTLRGEDGAIFMTDQPLGVITVYSIPYNIEGNVKNVKIENFTFKVINNGVDFHDSINVITAIGVNGLTIENCYFDDFWGDAICLAHYGDTPKTGERTRNQNVKILNNTIIGGDHHSNRNGISVINGKNIIIKGNIIKNTSRKDMPGGIDVEPNNSAYTIENIRILNNTFEGIKTNAIQIYIPTGGPAHFIFVEKNTIKECGIALNIGILSNETDNLKLTGNVIDGNTNPFHFWGEGNSKNWIVSDNTFNKPSLQNIPGSIKVENLVVKNNKKKRLIRWIVEDCPITFWSGIFIFAFIIVWFIKESLNKFYYLKS